MNASLVSDSIPCLSWLASTTLFIICMLRARIMHPCPFQVPFSSWNTTKTTVISPIDVRRRVSHGAP